MSWINDLKFRAAARIHLPGSGSHFCKSPETGCTWCKLEIQSSAPSGKVHCPVAQAATRVCRQTSGRDFPPQSRPPRPILKGEYDNMGRGQNGPNRGTGFCFRETCSFNKHGLCYLGALGAQHGLGLGLLMAPDLACGSVGLGRKPGVSIQQSRVGNMVLLE